jgi:hypothetical protein
LAGHGEMRNTYKILVGKPKRERRSDHSEDVRADAKTILK